MSGPSVAERLRQTRRLLASEGVAGVTLRMRERAAAKILPPGSARLPVTRADMERVAAVAAAGWKLPEPLPAAPGEALTIAWVTVPPSAGSGGATTMFRMISALEHAGHTCIVYLDDQHAWSLDQHIATIRAGWPRVRAEIRDLAAGIEDAHAIFATSWQTAYPVLGSPARGTRFYFVQDHEPSFYPAGSHAMLAEATYRFGFHGVTAGRWLAELLPREFGMAADHFDFGCDLERYGLDTSPGAHERRTAVCYYCRPSTPRRAFELAVVALDLFAQRHPEVDIHLFGRPVSGLPFPATVHGKLTPGQLNDLYNRCIAGLTLSATNVSLVPHEMLAAGCLPIVNEAEHNRIVLDNPEVVYADPTPFGLADALSALVERAPAERTAAAAAAAASVSSRSWDDAGRQVDRIVRAVVTDAARPLAA